MKEVLLIGVLLLQAPVARPTGVSVSGRLSFADGMPVSQALLNLVPVPEAGRQAGQPRTTFVDTSGAFRLQNVPAGPYLLRLGGFAGEAPIYYPGVTAESAAIVVTVSPDTNIENLNLTLPRALSGVRVTGRVTVPPNQNLQTATQRVQILGGSPGPQINTIWQLTGSIAADGTFEVPHVRPGSYTITITQTPGVQPRAIVVSDIDLVEIELSVPRLIPVNGTVATENGSARPRFSVAFEGAFYRTNVAVGAEGTFTVRLPEGEYIPRVTGLPAGYYVKALATDKADLLTGPFKIAAADSSAPIKLTFGTSAGVKVSGRVIVSGRDGASTSVKNIMLMARAADQLAEAAIEPDGSFSMEKVMPGSYVARVTLASNLLAPAVSVVLPDKDVRDFEITVPGEVEVFGRVAVDGFGPPPRFTLLLAGSAAEVSAAKPGELPALSANALFALRSPGAEGTQGVQLNINALPDGSFKMRLPEGSYRVAAGPGPNGIPPAYFIRSLTYGPADLLKEPMTVSAARLPELQVGLGTTAPNPWVKVSGRVIGFDPGKAPFRVALEGRQTATVETLVNPDGSFEFLRILQGSAYTAKLVPANDSASSPVVNVTDKDVSGIEIVVPREKEVRIVSTVEDGGPLPGFVMSFAGSGSTVAVVVKPERDGSFTTKLPADERRVRVSGFPLGYVLKAATYGLMDVLKQPLKISRDDTSELKVAFGAESGLPFGSFKGRVTGLDPRQSGVQIVLNGVTAFSTFEEPVASDGTFAFSKIPQGTYVPTLLGANVSALLSPSTVVVSGSDPFEVLLAAPRTTARVNGPPADEGPSGVVVSNLAGSRETANESSAIANMRTLNTALVTYLSANRGRYGNIPDLVKAGLIDGRFNGVVSGFTYSIIAVGSNYTAAAIPAAQGTARYGFYSTPDGVIRYSTLDTLAPPRQSGNPVQ